MDEKRILSLLDGLGRYYKELEKHIPKGEKDYQKNIEKKRFTERTLQLLIETCIDVCQCLVRDLKLGLPTEEEGFFDKLHEAHVISEEMSLKLKDMKKFRNVLIHKYVEIDDSLVYDHATKERKDFIDFKKEILEFLKEQKKK